MKTKTTTTLTTVKQIVDAFGGYDAVMERFGWKRTQVDNWVRQDKLPHEQRLLLLIAVSRSGIKYDPHLFGVTPGDLRAIAKGIVNAVRVNPRKKQEERTERLRGKAALQQVLTGAARAASEPVTKRSLDEQRAVKEALKSRMREALEKHNAKTAPPKTAVKPQTRPPAFVKGPPNQQKKLMAAVRRDLAKSLVH